MTPLFLFRLVLDFVAVSLLLAALAYHWLSNTAHEMIGRAMFLLLVAHNIFNRRWYGTLRKCRREARGTLTKAINLSLLVTMMTLLGTSVIISQTVFSFLQLTSTFTARQIHTLAAYLALIIAAVHLGLHWTLIMGVARARLGLSTSSNLRTIGLRAGATVLAVYGVYSVWAVDLMSKLTMRIPMGFAALEISTLALFGYHAAMVGLFASLAHYTLRALATKIAVGRF